MPATVTLTGTNGPAIAVTAVPFTDVSQVVIDFNKNMIQMTKSGEQPTPISIAAATTVTATKTGNLWTLTIS
jgi:hypothetical protein